MRLDDKLYKTFLEELNSLENFRMTYAADHLQAPLDRDDPDVKRLTEAMAFFSARTRLAALNNVFALQRRIFSQFFPFLLNPMPATGILHALPSGQFVESLELPKGTEMAVSPQSGGTAYFRTMHDLRIVPLVLKEARTLLLPNQGFRLLLRFRAPYPRNDEIGCLNLHINHLNDFLASLRVFHTLRECLLSVMAVFEDEVSETSCGPRCEISFGAQHSNSDDTDEETPHPMVAERAFFHFPQQELYINVQVPEPPRNWQEFTLCFDLSPHWPRNLVLNRDIFHLFAVPVTNCRRTMAKPILCDGTQERYTIRHPKPQLGFDLHSVLGVYEVHKDHLEPMQPGILMGGNGSYEIEQITDAEGVQRHKLNLHFPEAFAAPRTIAVDALWLQPWFSESMHQPHRITPYSRSVTGVRWEWLGDVAAQTNNPYLENTEGILHLLTLTNKSTLNFADLLGLLTAMGTPSQLLFQRAMQNLDGVRVEQAPVQRGRGPGLLKQVYYLQTKNLDPPVRPLMEIFAEHAGKVLDAWVADTAVEVRLETA